MRYESLLHPDIFVIHGFLSADECERFRVRSELMGYGDAPITTPFGFQMMKQYRNNDRVMLDDIDLASQMFDRLRIFLPPHRSSCELVGLNERFRFYRYAPGQRFRKHMDGCHRREGGDCSQLTFMIYL